MDAYKANLKQTANQEVPKTFRKQELTEKSRLELEAGGTVKVSGLVDKKGKAYQATSHGSPARSPPSCSPRTTRRRSKRGVSSPPWRTRCRWRSIPRQDRRGDPQPERSPAIRTAAPHRGAETAAGAQAGAERGPETGTEAGAARQAQAQPGCPPDDFPRHSVNELPGYPVRAAGITFVKPLKIKEI